MLTKAEQNTIVLQKELSTQAPQIEQRLGQYSILQRHKGAIEADADLNQYYLTMKSHLQQNYLMVMALNTGEAQLSTDMVDIAIQVCAVASGKYIPIAGVLVDVLEKTATTVHAIERHRYINNLNQLVPTLDKIEIYSECLAIECTFYKKKQIKEAATSAEKESLLGQLSGFVHNMFQGGVERKYLLYKLRTGHNPNAVEKIAIIDAYQLLIIMMSAEVKSGQGDKPIMTQILQKLLGDEYQNTALVTITKPSAETNTTGASSAPVSREEFEAFKKQLLEKNNNSNHSQIETVIDNGNGSASIMVHNQELSATPLSAMPMADILCLLLQQYAQHDAYIQQTAPLLAHYAQQQGIIMQGSQKERERSSQQRQQLLGREVDEEKKDDAYSFDM